MKRHLIYFFAALIAVVSFGCSSDDVEQRGDVELTIRLTMSHEMDTRSARPLDGVDNWQHVTDVRVYVFRADTEDGEYTLYNPGNSDNAGETETPFYINVEEFYKSDIYKNDEYEQHTVIVKHKLPDGYYRLLAIGVDENTDLFNVIKRGSKWDDIVKTFDDPRTEEFFSGYSETVHISSSIDKNFISIELKRCVAGVLLYVKNVPTLADGVSNIKLLLSGYSHTTDIVNRKWKSDAFEPELPIELIDFSKDLKEETIDGEARYYAGKFLIPSNTGTLQTYPTLRLAYYDKDGQEIKDKSKNVVLIGEWDNDYGYDYENPELSVDKKRIHYNILANRIYCIGFRSEEKKEPLDLSDDSNEVRIIAYGSWQADVDIEL